MRTLSTLSLLGLLAFIGFSSVGRADVYDYDDPTECNECEVYDEYDENADPVEIVNNYNITNYVWIDINQSQRQDYRNYATGPIAYPPTTRPYYPYPQQYHRPICRIGRGGYWGNIFELWWGNQVYQRAPYGVIVNSYWYLVRSGQCIAG